MDSQDNTISFNIPPYYGTELEYIGKAISSRKISGDGPFTRKCSAWIEEQCGTQKTLLTTSGTSALEMASLLCSLSPGDEVILPSFTFPSTATAFVLSGARLVFVDIRPDTMNIDEKKIEAAITKKTKAICVVHYAGVSCEMDSILGIAQKHGLFVIEDAAQGVMSTYKGQHLGTIGDFGCYSFHETKNYSMGEGGALLIQDSKYNEKAEILREKGTDRSKFYRGQIDKYSWIDYGSSYLPSELNAAYLWAQLEQAEAINANRLTSWSTYYRMLSPLAAQGKVALPHIPEDCVHNAHMFYLKCSDVVERAALIEHLKVRNITAVFHYVPLHNAPAGKKFGHFHGADEHTTSESERLVRLPLYYGLSKNDQTRVVEAVKEFFDNE